MDHLCYLCLVFFMLLRLVIDASWSHAVKGLTTWLLFVMFVMFNCVFFHLTIWYPGSCVVLDRIDNLSLPPFLLLLHVISNL